SLFEEIGDGRSRFGPEAREAGPRIEVDDRRQSVPADNSVAAEDVEAQRGRCGMRALGETRHVDRRLSLAVALMVEPPEPAIADAVELDQVALRVLLGDQLREAPRGEAADSLAPLALVAGEEDVAGLRRVKIVALEPQRPAWPGGIRGRLDHMAFGEADR